VLHHPGRRFASASARWTSSQPLRGLGVLERASRTLRAGRVVVDALAPINRLFPSPSPAPDYSCSISLLSYVSVATEQQIKPNLPSILDSSLACALAFPLPPSPSRSSSLRGSSSSYEMISRSSFHPGFLPRRDSAPASSALEERAEPIFAAERRGAVSSRRAAFSILIPRLASAPLREIPSRCRVVHADS